jgi:GntR family transcriptional regulator/MocR family aminotransferase
LTKTAIGDGALTLAPRTATPAYRWLCSELRAAILEGRLRPGTRLPATRDLALTYRLSRGTVVAAFEQMKAEGYVTGRQGSGTYVNTTLPDALLSVARPPRSPRRGEPSPPQAPRHLSAIGRRVRAFPAGASGPARAFRANQPALDLFPTTLWAQVASRCLRRTSADLLRGGSPLGHKPLRQAVADYLGASRGVRCTVEQVAIVSGVQEALDLVGRLVLDPGDRVCMENPGYIGAALAFDALGARVCGLPLDDEGMVLPGARQRGARLAYVTPAHQFPVGTSMSLARRLALLEWARKSGALLFEDDYDSEYRYSGLPLPALQGLDRHGLVVFAGSFSKVLFPSLRLAYLVIPVDLVDRVAAIKSAASRYQPLLDQAVLCEFITEGHFGRHVRRMRESYGARLAVLLESARKQLAGLLAVSPVEAGLQTVGWLERDIDGVTAAAAAARRNLEVIPLSRYARPPIAREGLLLGFAAVDVPEIQRGVRELAMALTRNS